MSDFWIYVETGLYYGLDIRSYHLILFLVALTIPYSFKDWKRVMLLLTVFAFGYVLALLLSSFGIIIIKMKVVGFLVPISVLLTALYNLFNSGKSSKNDHINIIGFFVFFFGAIHGLVFADFFKTVFSGIPSNKILSLLEFTLGMEGAQLTIALAILILSYIIHTFFRFSRRDFIVVLSAFMIGVVVPMIITNQIWN
jgi:hypothetical protein